MWFFKVVGDNLHVAPLDSAVMVIATFTGTISNNTPHNVEIVAMAIRVCGINVNAKAHILPYTLTPHSSGQYIVITYPTPATVTGGYTLKYQWRIKDDR